MRTPRIYAPLTLTNGSEVALPSNAANHLVRVLRLREGADVLIFDGQGHEHHANIIRIAGSQVSVRIDAEVTTATESPLRITLTQGISRGERMDWTLQKATELGIHAITPVLTTRSVVKLDTQQATKKQEHWQGVVIGACEQSGRNLVPTVYAPISLRQHLNQAAPAGLRLLLDPTANISLHELHRPDAAIELLIGPEGGLDDVEIAHAKQAGFIGVRLGPRILRTETAAMVALSVLQAQWGDLH